MKIVSVTDDYILFDNNKVISFFHLQDCCEWNYADFAQLDDIARATDFDPNLDFEALPNEGFRFGNKPNKMFFVPCYSAQNGYYSDEITISYNGNEMLSFDANEISDL